MMDLLRQSVIVQKAVPVANGLRRHRLLGIASVLIFLVTLYWSLIASDRYVSKACLVIDRTDLSNGDTMDFASILGGGKGSHDLHLMQEYLLSVDMLEKLDARLDLRAHYSDSKRDFISRMWFKNSSLEWFHKHYLSRISIQVDDMISVLRIDAQAYTPEMAYSIASLLVEEGERFMNEMAHRLAREQVAFLEKEVSQMNDRLLSARKAALDYQNAKGLLSPEATAASFTAIISGLESRLSDLKARRKAMLGYLNPKVPAIAQVNLEIAALEKQLTEERARLASPQGQTLNVAVEEYQRLQMDATFAQDLYRAALVALEKGRVEATRTLKKVSILQTPTRPEYPLEPRRIYNIVVFFLSTFVVTGILYLLAAIVRDHSD